MARPTFKPTVTQRRKVEIAAGAGMAHEDIALALGICRNTLAKHFDAELSTGAMGRRLDMLGAMYASGLKGNVAAQRAYVALTPRVSAPAPVTTAPAKKGKKEAQAEEAVVAQVGSDWAELLPTTRAQ